MHFSCIMNEMAIIQIAKFIQTHFYLVQMVLGAIFLAVAWFLFRSGKHESQFRVRESERNIKFSRNASDLGKGKLHIQKPFMLTGISLDGKPHEILGVSPQASEAEIQKAYRDLMKIYHPDKIGRPGSREWKDAQKIAEVINQAKASLLKKK